MQPSQFGHTLLCLCVSFGVGVCAQAHVLCVYIYMCVFVRVLLCAHARVCVCSDWLDKCSTPLRCYVSGVTG